jgi:hypothetical protein
MGPFIPSITLTGPNEITCPLLESTEYREIWDEAPGVLGKAMTSRGRLVDVWKPNPKNSWCDKYFCHGHSLGTYRRYGYSVFSGKDIFFALEDECYEIGAGQRSAGAIQVLKVGDIVSFAELSGRIMHTAKVFCIDINPSDPLRPIKFADITLLTKNGCNSDYLQPILNIVRTYPMTRIIRFWRPR